jgi:hypothetical protein
MHLDYCLVNCSSAWSGRSLSTFRKNVLSLFLELKIKNNKKPTRNRRLRLAAFLLNSFSIMKMEAIRSFETSVDYTAFPDTVLFTVTSVEPQNQNTRFGFFFNSNCKCGTYN